MIWIIENIIILLSLIALAVGMFIFFRPKTTIEIQKRFYEKINWRIEPISYTKEIRNTKIMGIFLILIGICAILTYIIKVL